MDACRKLSGPRSLKMRVTKASDCPLSVTFKELLACNCHWTRRSGKALPAPQIAPTAQTHDAPAEGVQAQIAAIWARILGVPKVGAKDNFFALGGHSLLAVQAHRDIKAALNSTKLSITDIFRFPTLAALALHLGDAPKPVAAVAPGLSDRADARADAMARRRAMRADRA